MVEKTVKTVKVPDSKADEWENYVDGNPEFESVSNLIRLSVQRELNGSYERPRESDSGADHSGEILTAVQQIQTAMGDVEERLSALEEREKADKGFSLEKAIYSILPEGQYYSGKSAEQYESDDVWYSSRDLANKLGADIGRVEETLRTMAGNSGLVQIEEMDDGRIYAVKENR